MLVEMTLDAELLEEPAFEVVEHADVHIAHVDQQDLGRAADAGVLIEERAAPIDDADVVETLDPPKGGTVAGIDEAVDGGVEDLAAFAEPALRRTFGREQRTDQDRPLDRLQVGRAGEEPLQDGADAANLAGRLVGDVNDDILIGHTEFLRVLRNRPESGGLPKAYESAVWEPIWGMPGRGFSGGPGKSWTMRWDDNGFRTPIGGRNDAN